MAETSISVLLLAPPLHILTPSFFFSFFSGGGGGPGPLAAPLRSATSLDVHICMYSKYNCRKMREWMLDMATTSLVQMLVVGYSFSAESSINCSEKYCCAGKQCVGLCISPSRDQTFDLLFHFRKNWIWSRAIALSQILKGQFRVTVNLQETLKNKKVRTRYQQCKLS